MTMLMWMQSQMLLLLLLCSELLLYQNDCGTTRLDLRWSKMP